MSESLTDLLATDAELDAIASRQGGCGRDLVLAELALLAAAVDDVPLPPATRCGSSTRSTNARKGGWALSVTVALMITSSGVAAAVSENPLAPLHYVTTQWWNIGPHGGGKIPGWNVNGSMPISTVPAGQIPGASVPAGGSGSTQSDVAGRIGSGAGSTGSGSGSGSGFGRGGSSGGGTGPGGHPPASGPGSGSGSGPGSGQGGNSGDLPPPSGGGRDPHNIGDSSRSENQRGHSAPSLPGEPRNPGHQNEHLGRPYTPGYAEVPGTGSGSATSSGSGVHPCRVDHPAIPGSSSWSDSPALPPCPGHGSGPGRSTTQQPGSHQQPKMMSTPPQGSSGQPSSGQSGSGHPTSTGPTPSAKPETSPPRGSLR